MNTLIATAGQHFAVPRQAPTGARTVLRLLQKLRHGSLTIQLPNGELHTVGDGNGTHASVHLHNWKPLEAALKSGDIGFAESYIEGHWTTPHLADLLRLLLANREAMARVIHGSWIGRLLYRWRHLLNHNSKANSRRNIHAHYDLGNGFYRLWLDSTMNYSAAWFNGRLDGDMQQAQEAKVRRALQMAGVQADSRVLEIGCGWGALAQMATQHMGAHVTGVTLSTEQLTWAQQRLSALGLAEKADLRLQDYRDIQDEPFDAICSIEMLEAVGQAYWPVYFERVAALLKTGGRACIQSIVIRDDLFSRYVKSTDFIQQYIFPGGCLPSPSAVRAQAEAAGLKVVDEMAFGPDYAETCRRWHKTFLSRKADVLAMGFDERFIRIWEFYLAYCEAGFDAGDIDVVQFTLAR